MTDDPKKNHLDWLRAQAAIDQELDATHALRLEEELESNETLQRALQSGRALKEVLNRHARKEQAPAQLSARVLALVAAETPRGRAPVRYRRFAALAASLAAVAFAAGYLTARDQFAASRSEAPQALVAAFARGELSGQPFDIASSDRHTVKPWLAARIPFGAEVVDLADLGFPLAGGRLDIVDRLPVATLVYRRREHWIEVSELPLRLGTPDGSGAPQVLDGYRMRQWSDGARAYVAISDIDEAELTSFVQAFRSKAAPAASEPAKP
jgi:anti-sigma factor RsiW